MCSQNTRKLMLAKSMVVMINYITKYDWLEVNVFLFYPFTDAFFTDFGSLYY